MEAYLIYALYDQDSNRYEVGKKVLSRNAANQHEILEEEMYISEDGYMETFVVNETSEDVWFDNMMVMSITPVIVQETHYDPWGLELTGLGFQYGGIKANKYLYNGKELIEDNGLQYYDYGARMYDPAIGRWGVIDPLSDQMRRYSPYNYAFDNPIRFIDPDGMAPVDDYGFDTETGQLSLIKKTDDDFDVIFTGSFDDEGSFDKSSKSIEVSKGVLEGEFFDDISTSGLVFSEGKLREGLGMMKFLSFESNIELSGWAFETSIGEGLSISPWKSNTEGKSRDIYSKSERVGYLGEKLFNIHTHPGSKDGRGGNGYPSPADYDARKNNPNNPHYIMSKNHGITRFNNQQTYTVVDLDKYFK